ncbi:MAG: hypothetical protein JWQ62_826, partial [Lacunisphaera sp.]|nr:hypothetical protein [Lacunisphaera sp.]
RERIDEQAGTFDDIEHGKGVE